MKFALKGLDVRDEALITSYGPVEGRLKMGVLPVLRVVGGLFE